MTYRADLASDTRGRVAPKQLPTVDTAALFRLYAVHPLAKGQAVTAAVVDRALVPWINDLDPETQAADVPFVSAIQAAVLSR